MSQKLTINLNKEEVTKLIKDNLVQKDENDTPIQYDVKFDVKEKIYSYIEERVIVTVVENITIGVFPGEINEVLDRNAVNRMLKNNLEIGDYELTDWSYIIADGENSFSGIEVSMVPSDKMTTFIKVV
jgi:hypothetical protein